MTAGPGPPAPSTDLGTGAGVTCGAGDGGPASAAYGVTFGRVGTAPGCGCGGRGLVDAGGVYASPPTVEVSDAVEVSVVRVGVGVRLGESGACSEAPPGMSSRFVIVVAMVFVGVVVMVWMRGRRRGDGGVVLWGTGGDVMMQDARRRGHSCAGVLGKDLPGRLGANRPGKEQRAKKTQFTLPTGAACSAETLPDGQTQRLKDSKTQRFLFVKKYSTEHDYISGFAT